MKKATEALIKFRNERDWDQYHTPENLTKSIMIEAAELLENFQWQATPKDIDNVKDEIADILAYTLMLCERYDYDPETLVLNKIKKNALKYPLNKGKL